MYSWNLFVQHKVYVPNTWLSGRVSALKGKLIVIVYGRRLDQLCCLRSPDEVTNPRTNFYYYYNISVKNRPPLL